MPGRMKGKTKRQLARIWGDIRGVFDTLGITITIVTAILAPLLAVFSLVFISWVLAIVWVSFLIATFFIRRRLSQSETEYFEPVAFGEPNEETILRAVDGILNTQRVAPYYVHVAPQPDEVKSICSKLRDHGFAKLLGASGSGKSMAAYEAAFLLQSEEKYQVYRLNVEELAKKTSLEYDKVRDSILNQLDKLGGNGKKLVIVDDAHRLAIGEDLLRTLRKETEEANGRVIWIETEFPSSELQEVPEDECIRLSFINLIDQLLYGLYFSSDRLIQQALRQRSVDLDDAIKRFHSGKIRDVWHFNFCATKGWDRLAQEVLGLSDFDLLVLFLVSSHTVISGEQELHTNGIVNRVRSLETVPGFQARFQWVREYGSVRDALEDLAKRKLVQMYDKDQHDKGYVASLHYNFAREVIKFALSRGHLTEDLLISVKLLLTDDYLSCEYFGVFHRDIGKYAASFDRENKNWLLSFLSDLLPVRMGSCSVLLDDMAKSARSTYEELLGHLEVETLSQRISSISVGQFGELGSLLRSLGMRAEELREQLDLSQLAKAANAAQPGDFGKLAKLLPNLGERREGLIRKLNLSQLAKAANKAQSEDLGRLASLLKCLGKHSENLIKGLKLLRLAKAANAICSMGELTGVAALLDSLGSQAKELVRELNLPRLAEVANAAQPKEFEGLAKLLRNLGERRKDFIDKLALSQLAVSASGTQAKSFDKVAVLVNGFGDDKEKLTKELDFRELGEAANTIQLDQLEKLSALLSALGDQSGKLTQELDSETFKNKVKQVDTQLNKDWPRIIDGLTHLMASLGEDYRNEFVNEIEWGSFCMKCPIAVENLRTVGQCLENVIKQGEQTIIDEVRVHLRCSVKVVVEEIRKAGPQHYGGVAKFLWNCNEIDRPVTLEILEGTIDKFMTDFTIVPWNWKGVGQLVNAINYVNHTLAESFLASHVVRGRIVQALNNQNWTERLDEVRHMIKAFYRCAPSLWKIIAGSGWITADLSVLDLDSIYTETDMEMN